MKVSEVIRNHGLEDFTRTYRNQYGNLCHLIYFDELANMEVKSVNINFPTKEATITVIERIA